MNMTSAIALREATPEDALRFHEHLVRNFAESGRDGDLIFHPVTSTESWNPAERVKKFETAWTTNLDEVGWEKVWVLDDGAGFRGHLDLKSAALTSGLHRATLGIGIERSVRGQGWGRRLCETAITWARRQKSLDWIDLYVFTHNESARELYRSLGFEETGSIRDLFRIHDQSIDDVHMCLRLR